MTCPLHKFIQELQADGSVTGGSVNGAAGAIEFVARRIANGQNLISGDDGAVDARVQTVLSIPLEVQSEWVRGQLDDLVTTAQKDGAEVKEIAGGYGGVRIRGKDGEDCIYILTTEASETVDGIVLDMRAGIATVQLTKDDGSQYIYRRYDLSEEDMIALLTAAALAQAQDNETYALVTARLLQEFGQDGSLAAVILQVARGRLGGVEVEDEEGDVIVRPSIDSIFNDLFERYTFTEVGSTFPCPNGEDLEECLRRRRRKRALDYERGGLRIRMGRLEEGDVLHGLPEKMDWNTKRKYEDAVQWIKHADEDVRTDAIIAFAELIVDRALPVDERAAAIRYISKGLKDETALVRAEAAGTFCELLEEDVYRGRPVLAKDERREAMRHILSALGDENKHVQHQTAVFFTDTLITLFRTGYLEEDEKSEAVRRLLAVPSDWDITGETLELFVRLVKSGMLTDDEKNQVVQRIMSDMASDGFSTRANAASALSMLAEAGVLTDAQEREAVQHFLKGAQDEDKYARMFNVSALIRFMEANAIPKDLRREVLQCMIKAEKDNR